MTPSGRRAKSGPFALLGLCGKMHTKYTAGRLGRLEKSNSMNNENLLRNILIGGALTGLLAVVLIKLGRE